MSRIEQIIGEIEEYISSCKAVPLSGSKIYVNKEELEELIRELRLKTPDEIKKYQKLISNKDAILADAKDQAEQMVRAAQIHTEELINEHEIMQRAYEQANQVIAEASGKAQEILDRAAQDANNIRLGAIQYTDEMLGNLQMIIEHFTESNRSRFDSMLSSLEKDLNIVVANRKELHPEQEEDASLAENVQKIMDGDGTSDEE